LAAAAADTGSSQADGRSFSSTWHERGQAVKRRADSAPRRLSSVLAGCLGAGLGCAILVALASAFWTTNGPTPANSMALNSLPDLGDVPGLPVAAQMSGNSKASVGGGGATASTGKTLTHRELVDQATSESTERHQVTRTATGAAITCALQAMEAQVTADGLAVTSTAKDEGGGFSMAVGAVGRLDGSMATAGTGRVEVADKTARLIRPLTSGAAVIEEVTTSAEGIRQDFVLPQKPTGEAGAPVLVALRLTGATITALTDDRVSLRLDASGRALAWHGLAVTDATGRSLPARFVQDANGLEIRVDDAGATYPVRIDPTFTDADWLSLGGVEGASGDVYAMAWYQMQLCVSGYFSAVGTTAANNIALWNGSTWTALGSGTDALVYALAVSGSNLYAGGIFTTAGGISAIRIAKWDGTTWSALGSGMNDQVWALAVSGSDLYAGGWFTTAGGVAANYTAKWNGSAWSALGSGMNGKVMVLAVSGSDLYAGGEFTTAGGTSVNHIAKWNGATWSALGTGMDYAVYALAVSGGDLYAGGFFTTAGGTSANYIAKWDGSTWSALGSGLGYRVVALAVSGGDLYAGGWFTTAGGTSANYIAKWNGSAWSALGSGMNGNVQALAVLGSELYAGGLFTMAGGTSANRIAKWNSSTWSSMGTGPGVNARVYALAVSGSDLYAGGAFTLAGGAIANYIAKWDGSTWSALGSGMSGGTTQVNALAVSGSDLYAGGYFTTAGGTSANNIAKWDGTTWSALGSGVNSNVYSLAMSGSDLYVGGGFTTAGGASANRIAKWDGTSWWALGTGMNINFVNALAISGGTLYAGGSFTTAGGISANHIAKWDGSTWSALGSGLSAGGNSVQALVVSGSDLYAGGDFLLAGGASANYIAKWNGSTWSALGSGLNSTVLALVVSGSDLYVGGNFATAGGTSANNIAKWDGTTWSPLGSGMNIEVLALAISGNNLYAGGWFTTAGGKVSPYCAQAALKGLIAVDSTTATVAESGATATITASLPLVPTSDVLVTLTPSDPSQATVNPTTLLFTAANWSPKSFTITATADAIADGPQVSTIVLGAAFSSDTRFSGFKPDDITVTTTNSNVAGITLGAATGTITEAGGAATMNVSLTSQPTATVTVAVASSNPNQGTVAPASLTFTAANWFLPQTVTITGADGDGVNNPDTGTGFNVTLTGSGAAEYVMSRSQAELCYPSNAVPTLTAIADQTIAEDSVGTVVNLAGIGSGQAGENQVLTVTATSSDPTILPNPTVSYVSPAAIGTLTLTPLANQNGVVTVTVTVTDDATIGLAGNKDPAKSLVRTFTVTVSAVNDAPVLIPGVASLNAQNEDDVASAGTPLSVILGALTITDVDAGAVKGTAITAADTTLGNWQYTINGGANWFGIGAVADATARLLADNPNTRLRFVPGANQNGNASLTLRAWDQTSGVNGGTANATTNGGITAFSSATATATVTINAINDAPVLSSATGNPLTPVSNLVYPGTPVASLIYGLVSDVDAGAVKGIAITGIAGAGGGGNWEYTIDNGGTWSAIVAAPTAALLLSDAGTVQVRYRPQTGENGTATLTFRAWDRTSGAEGGTGDATVNGGTTAFSTLAAISSVAVISAVNNAPVLSGANDLTGVTGGLPNPGTPVASLIYGHVTDVDGDPQGIAITGSAKTAMATGQWQYSTTNGGVWNDLPAVSDASALILTDAGSVLVRYEPASGEGGTATLTFRAWDRTSGLNGETVNATSNGGNTAYSSATAVSSITVTAGAVNHAPVLSGVNDPTGVIMGQPNPGTPVASLIYAKVTDVDGDPQGIAITGSAKTAMATGKWQYSTTNGNAWTDLPAVSDANVLLLTDAGSVLVRYEPQSGENGTATLTIRAWDRTSGLNGGTGNATTNGGATAYSTATAVSSIAVSAGVVNHAPVLAGANDLTAVIVGQPNPGTPVASLIYGKVTDVDNDPQGIAITGGAKTAMATGKWQYSTTNGGVWNDLPAVSDASALLLTDAGSVLVRYEPQSGESGTATLTIRAWDRTSGTNGGTADATTNGGNTACSSATALSSITVSAGVINHAPVLTGGNALNGIAEDVADADNPGTPVAALINGLVSDIDVNAAQGLAVTGVTGGGTWQYTIDSGTDWYVLTGAVSASSARLLSDQGTVLVRYHPALNENGAATITFRAWDRTSGTNGGTADVTTNGGATAYSSATAISSIAIAAVNDAPTLSATLVSGGTGPADQDLHPVITVVCADVDAAVPITLTIGIGAGTVSGFASAGGVVVANNGTATVSLTGTVGALTAYLNAKTITCTPDPYASGTVVLTCILNDGGNTGLGGPLSATATMDLTITSVNHPPLLSGTANDLPAVAEDGTATGMTIDALVGGTLVITDPDNALRGLAITAATGAGGGGAWQYRTTVAGVWTALPALGANQVFPLSADGGGANQVRYQPVANENGIATITYRAWDRSSGVNAVVATEASPGTGTSAYSLASLTSRAVVTPVNDAPVLTGVNDLTTVIGGMANPGTPVASLIYGHVTDVDNDPQGIAITGSTKTAMATGKWQYSTTNGSVWTDLPAVSDASALLLADAGSVLVRYEPQSGEGGTATLTVRAWDRSSGVNGGTGNATANGGITAYSSATALSSITVSAGLVNHAPVLTGANDLTGVTVGQPNPGTPVAGLIYGKVTDVDNDPQGIAITGSAKTAMATGKWQYSTTNGGVWTDLPVVSDASALLLTDAGSVLVRYAPQSGESGTATLTVRAWDRTSGVNGGTADVTTNGGNTAYSSATAISSITVTAEAVNHAPVLTSANNLTGVTGGLANPGTPVASLIYGQITDVDADPQGIAITGSAKTAMATGKWQYSTTNGGAWTDLPAVSDASALLLTDAGSVLVRYAPNTGESGTATLTIRAWDRTSGINGGTADVTANGGNTAYSAATATSSITVTAGVANNAPVLADADLVTPGVQGLAMSLIRAGSPNPGNSVASLIYGLVSDVDNNPQGIAVTGLSSTGTGTWAYTTDNGTTWTAMPAVSDANALLLTDAGTVLVRFSPTAGWDGSAAISYRAWDRSSGTNGETADATTNGGITAYSSATATSTAMVNGIVPPVVTLTAGAVTWTEKTAAVTIDSGATVTDADSANFNGGTLTVAIGPGRSGDRLEIPNGVSVPGVVSGGSDGASLIITLSAGSTPTATQTVLRSITYRNLGDNPAADPSLPENRTVTVTVNDGSVDSVPATRTLTVQPIDDPPTIQPLTLALVPGLTVTGQLVASDPEGQALTYAVVGGQTKGEPTVDAATGLLTYRNTFLDGQDDSFQVSATAGGKTGTATVTVRVTGAGTAIRGFTSVPPLRWIAGQIFSYTPTVTGLGAGVVFRLVTPPQVAQTGAPLSPTDYTFDPATGTVTIISPTVPTGDYLEFELLAEDANHTSVYQPVLLKITLGGAG
jgi:hypothetical protein